MPHGINHFLGSHHFSFQVVDVGCGDSHRNHGASAGGGSVAAGSNPHLSIHIRGKAQAAANQFPAAGVFLLHQYIDNAAHPGPIALGADGLLGGALVGALAMPFSSGTLQAALLLLSTLLVGIASAYELTARNKYCALLVQHPGELGSYLTSFSVVFNVGKLVGPPVGGLLVALTGPSLALLLDASTYILPIVSVVWLLQPLREQEQRSQQGESASLWAAWRGCGADLRHVLRFTALFCLVGFFHPGLAPVMAADFIGPGPQDLGLFTSVLAAGSITGGVLLQRNSFRLSQRPAFLLGSSALLTSLAQLGLGIDGPRAWTLAMAFLIGWGTAVLLSGTNLITQVGASQVLRGRMAGLGQIAFLGGGGLSGLLAAGLTMRWGLGATCAVLGAIGLVIAGQELIRHGQDRLTLASD